MRYSSDENDQGYRAFADAMISNKKIKVFLDDVEQKMCITADDEARYIKRAVLDENGAIVVSGDEIAVESVFGNVRIELH